MKFTAVTALAAFVGLTAAAKEERTFAVLTFTNKALTKGRVDPLVSPGKVASHAHQVMGGSGFGMASTGDDLVKSKCTNARAKADKSNYWFPKLYFHDEKDDSFEEVEVDYVNVYYFFEPTNDKIKPFPVGLGILSGDAMLRTPPKGGAHENTDPSAGPVNPVSFVCPLAGGNTKDNLAWPEASTGEDTGMPSLVEPFGMGVGFPTINCDGSGSPLRGDVHFPSCYNPKAGLLDFKNNMRWSEDNKGKRDCPKGWIHVPHMFLEVYWKTPDFANRWKPDGKKQPFVLANGDVTGYSNHADFMAGWDEDVLQNIIDNCNTGHAGIHKCPGVVENFEDCTIPSPVKDEDSTGSMSKLLGNNPLSGFSYGVAPQKPSGGLTMEKPEKDSGKDKSKTSASVRPEPTAPVYDSPPSGGKSGNGGGIPAELSGGSHASIPAKHSDIETSTDGPPAARPQAGKSKGPGKVKKPKTCNRKNRKTKTRKIKKSAVGNDGHMPAESKFARDPQQVRHARIHLHEHGARDRSRGSRD